MRLGRDGRTKLVAALAAAAAIFALGADAASGASAKGGQFEATPRIIGGYPATIDAVPYAAAISKNRRFNCAGSVITSRHVLTAAHCVKEDAAYAVVTRRTNLTDPNTGERSEVLGKFIPSDYRKTNRSHSGHDIAVLTLATPTTAPPVVIATEAEGAAAIRPGSILGTAGWGTTNRRGTISSAAQLKAAFIRAIPGKKCKRIWGKKEFKGQSMICTFGAKLNPKKKRSYRNSPCPGDSGGPLAAATAAGPRLLGAVSYGPRSCGSPKGPAVYAKAFDTYARSFISSVVSAPLPPPVPAG